MPEPKSNVEDAADAIVELCLSIAERHNCQYSAEWQRADQKVAEAKQTLIVCLNRLVDVISPGEED